MCVPADKSPSTFPPLPPPSPNPCVSWSSTEPPRDPPPNKNRIAVEVVEGRVTVLLTCHSSGAGWDSDSDGVRVCVRIGIKDGTIERTR